MDHSFQRTSPGLAPKRRPAFAQCLHRGAGGREEYRGSGAGLRRRPPSQPLPRRPPPSSARPGHRNRGPGNALGAGLRRDQARRLQSRGPGGQDELHHHPGDYGPGTVFVNGNPVFGTTPIEVTIVPGTNVITIVIIDGNHNRIQFDIQVDRGTPSALLIPVLESVSPKMDGSYTAVFGYVNPNAGSVDIPAGHLNGMRYQGRQAEYLGQPLRFFPGNGECRFLRGL